MRKGYAKAVRKAQELADAKNAPGMSAVMVQLEQLKQTLDQQDGVTQARNAEYAAIKSSYDVVETEYWRERKKAEDAEEAEEKQAKEGVEECAKLGQAGVAKQAAGQKLANQVAEQLLSLAGKTLTGTFASLDRKLTSKFARQKRNHPSSRSASTSSTSIARANSKSTSAPKKSRANKPCPGCLYYHKRHDFSHFLDECMSVEWQDGEHAQRCGHCGQGGHRSRQNNKTCQRAAWTQPGDELKPGEAYPAEQA